MDNPTPYIPTGLLKAAFPAAPTRGLHPRDSRGQYDASHNTGRNEPCWCGSGIKTKKCRHDAMRAKLEEQRAINRKEHREGTCPTCQGAPGQDAVTVPKAIADRVAGCPDCGRTLLAAPPVAPGVQIPGGVPASQGHAWTADPLIPALAPPEPATGQEQASTATPKPPEGGPA